ncbi:MAG: DUF2333 family protein [Pseudomonadales bacterium]|nr:DUF2333 family protein [Pseudomonadales bacterium]
MNGKSISLAVLLIAALFFAGAVYWSQEPDSFSVLDVGIAEAEKIQRPVVIGVTTTASLITIIESLLHKPGGFLANDKLPPFILMDNMPSWEFGVLVQARDMTRAMRDSISRSQSQSQEDPDLAKAESHLNIAHTSWAFPDAESEYATTVKNLRSYMTRLSDGNNQAQFYARSDNLRNWLRIVEVRLGSLSQRLSASVGQRRLNTDLAGDDAAQQSTNAEDELHTKTPWLEIDDVFYEARGASWALIHLLKAIEVDFAEVLKKKNAAVSVAQIIRELEATQQTLYSPMVLNGGGFGLWANHSLVMASYISRANAATIDLRELLEKG